MKNFVYLAIATLVIFFCGCELSLMPEVPASSKTAKSMFTKHGDGDLKEVLLFEGGIRSGVKITGTVPNAAAFLTTSKSWAFGVGKPLSFVLIMDGPITSGNGIDFTITPTPSVLYGTPGTHCIFVRLADVPKVFGYTTTFLGPSGGTGTTVGKDITVTLTANGVNIDVNVSGAGITFATATIAVNPSVFASGAYLAVAHNNDTCDVTVKSINGNALPMELE